jgi:putative endonuclease
MALQRDSPDKLTHFGVLAQELLQNQSMGTAGSYYVYILASRRHGTLYIGVTNNLPTRLEQHRRGRGSAFVKKYGVHILVHVEEFASALEAIAREKQLKEWRRD